MAKYRYTPRDAGVALALAARIHNTDAAVVRTAKSLFKNANSQTRPLLKMVMSSSRPLLLIDLYLKELNDEQTWMPNC